MLPAREVAARFLRSEVLQEVDRLQNHPCDKLDVVWDFFRRIAGFL
jgi:hypothetical protein